jgi:3-hydroxy acid dehydrogenase / malonic semialdehyde reductase
MVSLKDKIIFITGASSGIGSACARLFAAQGAQLLLCARRIDLLRIQADELRKEYKCKVHAFQLDVRRRTDVTRILDGLPEEWKGIYLLINNAGLARGLDFIHEGSIDDWEEMIDTNVKGLLYISRWVIPGMVARNEGHIVNLGSIAGRQVYPKGNVYCATKYAVGALTEALRLDLNGTPLRVSTVNPGLVETEFGVVRFHGNKDRADTTYRGLDPLTPEDIADAIFFCVTRPPHVNIQEVIIMPVAQASTSVVHRR